MRGRCREPGAAQRLAKEAAEREAREKAAKEAAEKARERAAQELAAKPPASVPVVENQKLRNHVDQLFKGTKNPQRVGDGTTMDAIRHEILTNQATHGRTHRTKGQDHLNGLNKWLKNNPNASASDRAVAQDLADRLRDAMNWKP